MLLELFGGIATGLFFLRIGLPSLFPLVWWLPLLSVNVSGWFILGLACVSISPFLHSDFRSSFEDVVIGFFTAAAGLTIYSFFTPGSFLDTLIFPLLLIALLGWFFSTIHRSLVNSIFGFVLLAVGWWLVHERVIPFVLPAFFSGWYGLSFLPESIYDSFSRLEKFRDACIGCFSGLLPGIGPGLVNALWSSNQSSPALGISNLVFSIGLLAQTGSVRSFFAAELGGLSSFPWWLIILFLGIGFVIVWSLRLWTIFSFSVPSPAWSFFHGAGLFLGGGVLSFLAFLFSFFLRRFAASHHASFEAGVFILIPSILLFYAP